MAGKYLACLSTSSQAVGPPHDIRFDGLRYSVQPVFNLTRLLPNRVERAGVIRSFSLHIAIIRSDIEPRLLLVVTEVVSSSSSNLSHVLSLGEGHVRAIGKGEH